MVITPSPELETLIREAALQRGISPEGLVLAVLRERFLVTAPAPQDAWERGLIEVAKNCGVSLPNSALSSDGLYD